MHKFWHLFKKNARKCPNQLDNFLEWNPSIWVTGCLKLVELLKKPFAWFRHTSGSHNLSVVSHAHHSVRISQYILTKIQLDNFAPIFWESGVFSVKIGPYLLVKPTPGQVDVFLISLWLRNVKIYQGYKSRVSVRKTKMHFLSRGSQKLRRVWKLFNNVKKN